MKLGNFNLFDTMGVTGMYDTVNGTSNNTSPLSNPVALAAAAYVAASSNVNSKSNHLTHPMQNNNQEHGQHSYPVTTEYNSSINGTNGYWGYTPQPYCTTSTRQYMQTPAGTISASDACSSPARHDLSYHTHGNYPHMQKMVGNYPTGYEFYQHHNAKYC